jgi:hypothetical protein
MDKSQSIPRTQDLSCAVYRTYKTRKTERNKRAGGMLSRNFREKVVRPCAEYRANSIPPYATTRRALAPRDRDRVTAHSARAAAAALSSRDPGHVNSSTAPVIPTPAARAGRHGTTRLPQQVGEIAGCSTAPFGGHGGLLASDGLACWQRHRFAVAAGGFGKTIGVGPCRPSQSAQSDSGSAQCGSGRVAAQMARQASDARVQLPREPITEVSSRPWYVALRAAGIEDFRWHDLRHTCIAGNRWPGRGWRWCAAMHTSPPTAWRLLRTASVHCGSWNGKFTAQLRHNPQNKRKGPASLQALDLLVAETCNPTQKRRLRVR